MKRRFRNTIGVIIAILATCSSGWAQPGGRVPLQQPGREASDAEYIDNDSSANVLRVLTFNIYL